jgi:aryl-alcohol dehydrogenase-like predicted oxidoreductase
VIPRRRLGAAGPESTAVGLGAWALGGGWEDGWGSLGDAGPIAAIQLAGYPHPHPGGGVVGRHPFFGDPALDRNLALQDALRPVAARHGVEAAAVAVAWTLAWPELTGAGAGPVRPA